MIVSTFISLLLLQPQHNIKDIWKIFIATASRMIFNWNKSSKILLLETPFSNLKETLLLIDIQKDYFPGGKMELVDMKEVVKWQHEFLKTFRTSDKLIFFIKHLSKRSNATLFIPETQGIDFHASISPLPEEAVIEKYFPNSFFQTELLSKLKKTYN